MSRKIINVSTFVSIATFSIAVILILVFHFNNIQKSCYL